MKRIFTILFAVLIYGFSATVVFAQSEKNQQVANQKMDQLQKILDRAVKSGAVQTPKVGFEQTAASLQALSPEAGVSDNATNVISNVAQVVAAPPSPPMPKVNPFDKAFSNVVNQTIPMSSQQVKKLHEVYKESQLAAATPPGIPPKPTSSSLLVDLSPKATPPVLRLGTRYVTAAVLMDVTGKPWPIRAYSVGDPSAFDIQWDRKGNTLLIQPLKSFKRSNLAVILQGLDTPVMIDLMSDQTAAVDYRVDLRVPGLGPNANFAYRGMPESANPELLNVLNGVPPADSKELKVKGGNCQAWLLGKKLYLRTNLTVISPGWQSIMSNIDGTHAYQLQPSPIILALQKGRDKTVTLMLEGL